MSTESTDQAGPIFEGWAILELMGHRRLAGYLSEVTIAGHGFVRLEIPAGPDGEPAATQFYAPGSVYAITPTTERMARLVRSRPQPVRSWEIPAPARVEVALGAAPDLDEGDDVDERELF